MSPRSVQIRKQKRSVDILFFCNKLTSALWMPKGNVTARKNKEDFIMQTGIKILKFVGKAAANAVIWIAARLERRR